MIYSGSLPLDYAEPLRSKRPRTWPAITPELHEQIKRLYLEKRGRSGAVREFSERHGLPRWKISRYAQEQAWTAKQKKEPDWTDEEIAILERHAHRSPGAIQMRLRRAGFWRSTVGIVLKRKRMRFLQNLAGMSANQAALCLVEDMHFITRAIRLGLLNSDRRQTARTPQQGGDTFFIREKSIRDFIIENLNLIDLRKVDKYWFVDLLVNGGSKPGRESEAA